MRKVSNKFYGRPMTSTETATWWVEYMIKHGSDPLRSPAMKPAWWQVQVLNIYTVILFIVVVSLYLTSIFIRIFIGILLLRAIPKAANSKKIK